MGRFGFGHGFGFGVGNNSQQGANVNQNTDLSPHFIEMMTFSMQSDVTANPTTEIIVTDTTNNVITLDTTAWGATSKIFPAAVKYANGKYDTVLIKSFDATTATADNNFADDVVLISNLHDSSQGQHLSNMGYKAMADHLFDYPRRYTLKRDIIKVVNPPDLTLVNNFPAANLNNSEGQSVFAFNYYNWTGGTNNGITSSIALILETLTPYITVTKALNISQGVGADKGLEHTFTVNYDGYIELIVGTNLAYTGTGIIKLLKDDVEVYSQTFSGAAKTYHIPYNSGSYKLRILTTAAEATSIKISSIIFNREAIDETVLFSSSDKVLFVADSWAVYPENAATTEARYDGTFPGGDCYMPVRFRERFEASGGNAANVLIAGRGGQTSVWAKYWIDKFITDVKPTKIVFNFVINDYGSVSKLPATASTYDFDPATPWLPKLSSEGGVFGSCDKATWKANLKYLSDYCISKKVTPIFFMPSRTASLAQTQAGMSVYNNFILGGV